MTDTMRTWHAVLLHDADGDTAKYACRLRKTRSSKKVDLGFHIHQYDNWEWAHEEMRFYRINAAEHGTPAGDAATAWLRSILVMGQLVVVQTILTVSIADQLPDDKSERYGRFLADVYLPDGTCVNDLAVTTGHAAYWDGHGPRPVPPQVHRALKALR